MDTLDTILGTINQMGKTAGSGINQIADTAAEGIFSQMSDEQRRNLVDIARRRRRIGSGIRKANTGNIQPPEPDALTSTADLLSALVGSKGNTITDALATLEGGAAVQKDNIANLVQGTAAETPANFLADILLSPDTVAGLAAGPASSAGRALASRGGKIGAVSGAGKTGSLVRTSGKATGKSFDTLSDEKVTRIFSKSPPNSAQAKGAAKELERRLGTKKFNQLKVQKLSQRPLDTLSNEELKEVAKLKGIKGEGARKRLTARKSQSAKPAKPDNPKTSTAANAPAARLGSEATKQSLPRRLASGALKASVPFGLGLTMFRGGNDQNAENNNNSESSADNNGNFGQPSQPQPSTPLELLIHDIIKDRELRRQKEERSPGSISALPEDIQKTSRENNNPLQVVSDMLMNAVLGARGKDFRENQVSVDRHRESFTPEQQVAIRDFLLSQRNNTSDFRKDLTLLPPIVELEVMRNNKSKLQQLMPLIKEMMDNQKG